MTLGSYVKIYLTYDGGLNDGIDGLLRFFQ